MALFVGVVNSALAGDSFRTRILPVLTKAGCNSGMCHGAATGQGGFRLSLLGYDPAEDHARITRELGGRRLDYENPAASLLLRKATGDLEHEGGRRLRRDEEGFRRLTEWVSRGAPLGDRSLMIQSIEVHPADVVLSQPRALLQPVVRATLSDGTVEDVTPWALWASNDDRVLSVGKDGSIRAETNGVGSVMIRYGGHATSVRVTVPMRTRIGSRSNGFRPRNLVDEEVQAAWIRLGVKPASRSADDVFLRRATLDLAGRLPTPAEVETILRRRQTDAERDEILERLMHTPEFADYWTLVLGDWLLVGGRRSTEGSAKAYHAWLRERVAGEEGVDRWVFELLTATGNPEVKGAVNLYAHASDPRDMGEHVASLFLGVQLGCARCHAHPTDRWTQEDYYGFASWFSGVRKERSSVVEVDAEGVPHPKTGRPVAARLLGVPTVESEPLESSRVRLAQWVTSPTNPFFARAFVNRVWRVVMGRGLVEPVDDLRPSNPASHPRLLDRLAEHFVRSGYSLRELLRVIMQSGVYQLGSAGSVPAALDERHYTKAVIKPLPAAVYLDAVVQVTGVGLEAAGESAGRSRAVQWPGPRVPSRALDLLGRCARETRCEPVSTASGGVALALHLINGPTINDRVRAAADGDWVRAHPNVKERIRAIWVRVFGREPTSAEAREFGRELGSSGRALESSQRVEDLLWALLNSKEFRTNH